ncbi:MAG TPA: hypothetical protein VK879_06700 [Candidatus Sulfomarinibacteraceae bacterium]|nr:hypothetical protein [Candidatus Sulfomarinibacteraceae bacterium]
MKQMRIGEMDELIAQAREMKRGLEAALECRCTGLADCVLGATADGGPPPNPAT